MRYAAILTAFALALALAAPASAVQTDVRPREVRDQMNDQIMRWKNAISSGCLAPTIGSAEAKKCNFAKNLTEGRTDVWAYLLEQMLRQAYPASWTCDHLSGSPENLGGGGGTVCYTMPDAGGFDAQVDAVLGNIALVHGEG